MAEPGQKTLKCVVVTPEATVVDQAASFVAVPLYDGELGVLPRRAPLIGRLGYGQLRIQADGTTARFYIDGGFLEIKGDVVTVLTPTAIPADQIDVAAAQSQLEAASRQVPTTEPAFAAKARAQAQARGQLAVARSAS